MSVEALPSAEALQVLLSPDGYYKYLSIEKPATNSASPAAAILNNGDGKEKQEVDADLVKKELPALISEAPSRPKGRRRRYIPPFKPRPKSFDYAQNTKAVRSGGT
mmetsp:Transcript_12390/g.15694  ORF Transcript_12390/g.15694 Transcript_12390/m.15694 type:complete len:106 (+) Transcript_12390:46-363(+)